MKALTNFKKEQKMKILPLGEGGHLYAQEDSALLNFINFKPTATIISDYFSLSRENTTYSFFSINIRTLPTLLPVCIFVIYKILKA